MRNFKVLRMSIHGMLMGLMILMTFIPQIGFISLSPTVSFTLLHIPVLFAALLFGWKGGLGYGTLFGLLSLIRAAVAPVTFIDAYFVNPLISVLPRIAFGLLIGIFFDLSQRISHRVWNKAFLGVSAFIMTMIHSVLVLFFLGLFEGPNIVLAFEGTFPTYWIFMGTVIMTNGIWEALIASIVVPILALATSHNPTVKKLRIM